MQNSNNPPENTAVPVLEGEPEIIAPERLPRRRGRPSKAETIDLTAPDGRAAHRTDKGLLIIPPSVDLAVKLALKGWDYSKIASEIGVSTKTVTNWMSRYRDYVDAQIRNSLTVEELINPLIPDAVRAYKSALNDPKANQFAKMNAAKDVLDRAMGRPVQRILSDENKKIEVVFRTVGAGEEEDVQGTP